MWLCSKQSNNPRKPAVNTEDARTNISNLQSRISDIIIACITRDEPSTKYMLSIATKLWNSNLCTDIYYDEMKPVHDFVQMAERQGMFFLQFMFGLLFNKNSNLIYSGYLLCVLIKHVSDSEEMILKVKNFVKKTEEEVQMSEINSLLQHELSDFMKSSSSTQSNAPSKFKRPSADMVNLVDPEFSSQNYTEGMSKRPLNNFIIKSAPWKHRQMKRREKVSLIEKASYSITQSIQELQEAAVVAVDLPTTIIDQFIGIGANTSDELILETFKSLTSSHKQYIVKLKNYLKSLSSANVNKKYVWLYSSSCSSSRLYTLH